jgi:hypothetical protein
VRHGRRRRERQHSSSARISCRKGGSFSTMAYWPKLRIQACVAGNYLSRPQPPSDRVRRRGSLDEPCEFHGAVACFITVVVLRRAWG